MKASNLLSLRSISIPVNDETRIIIPDLLDAAIKHAKNGGIKYFIVISNMATTMFGSVDDPEIYSKCLEENDVKFKIHIDGAFGGFIFPISCPDNNINFRNPHVSSVTLDAHKMLQAPYGTGIFIVRKGLMQFVCTKEAKYVNEMDITLSGSRSGTNAVAVWMILFTYGPHDWFEKINKLLYRTDWLCKQFDQMGIKYYRHPNLNIVAVRSEDVPDSVARKYGIVPDTHNEKPCWYKVVVMDHVEIDYLQLFIKELH